MSDFKQVHGDRYARFLQSCLKILKIKNGKWKNINLLSLQQGQFQLKMVSLHPNIKIKSSKRKNNHDRLQIPAPNTQPLPTTIIFCRPAKCIFHPFFIAYPLVACTVFVVDFRANLLAIGQTAVRIQLRRDYQFVEISFKSNHTNARFNGGIAVHDCAGDWIYFAQ
jgi:hypothetical protein